jgi:hypothetical protein
LLRSGVGRSGWDCAFGWACDSLGVCCGGVVLAGELGLVRGVCSPWGIGGCCWRVSGVPLGTCCPCWPGTRCCSCEFIWSRLVVVWLVRSGSVAGLVESVCACPGRRFSDCSGGRLVWDGVAD